MHARTIRPHNQNNCRISSDLRGKFLVALPIRLSLITSQ
jgi:hypothetical protein